MVYDSHCSGHYHCQTAEIRLSVPDKPSAPRNPRIMDLDATSLTLSWDEPEDLGGCPLTQYLVERRETNRRTFQVGGLFKGSLNS